MGGTILRREQSHERTIAMQDHTPQLPLFTTSPHDPLLEIPYGYCHCGCGQKTRLAPKTRSDTGWIKGEPLQFIRYHKVRAFPRQQNDRPSIPQWVEQYGLSAPYGKCQCGCGQDAPLAEHTEKKYGVVKGLPQRFFVHHHGRKPLEIKFWKKVDRRGPDECWKWTGAINQAGYGAFGNNHAHRTSYEITYGPIPDGLFILHKCDNPPCVNPNHLFVGTHQDNMRDMISKGRARYQKLRNANQQTEP